MCWYMHWRLLTAASPQAANTQAHGRWGDECRLHLVAGSIFFSSFRNNSRQRLQQETLATERHLFKIKHCERASDHKKPHRLLRLVFTIVQMTQPISSFCWRSFTNNNFQKIWTTIFWTPSACNAVIKGQQTNQRTATFVWVWVFYHEHLSLNSEVEGSWRPPVGEGVYLHVLLLVFSKSAIYVVDLA